MAELIARAKADPNELNYSSPGVGTHAASVAELLKLVGGIQITHVPFSGAGPAIQAVLGGTTQIACVALPPAHPQIESGALKALAVTGRGADGSTCPTCRPCRAWIQGFPRRHLPGVSGAGKDAAADRRAVGGEVDRNPEDGSNRRAIAQ